ncbi:MAG: hypothetical protein H7293_13305 [Candidatus Saccharibacteria bacterium]|nr:hypothetical protein [Rhodoferax sp.]
MTRFSRFSQQGFVVASVSAACVLLAGCGGGNSGVSTTAAAPMLQGLAATGAALANAAVTAKCATGAPMVGTTAADGTFTLTLNAGQTTPCMLQVVGGSPSVTLHGFAVDAGRVNITPLTDLVVTKALGTSPTIAFGSYDAAKGNVIRAGLDAAKSYVNTQVTAITGQSTLLDLLVGVFKVGDADDKILDSLAAATAAAGKTLSDLRVGAAQGAALKPIIQIAPPAVVVPPVVIPPVVIPPIVVPPIVTPPVVTPPVIAPPVVTPPVVTPPVSANECAPLLPKAGDSLTFTNTANPGGAMLGYRYDYTNTTYQGQSALALTMTATTNGVSSTGVTYTNPTTGAYLGATAAASNSTTVTTFDPPDYQERINNAFYNVGQIATVAVKARVTGPGISTGFATIGGATALTMDYTYTVERKPNESLSVPAGTFANSCKLQINVMVGNIKLEGNDGSNPLFSTFFPVLSASFSQPFKSTVWLTNKLPQMPKTFIDSSSSYGTVTSTQELTAYTLAPR